MTAGFSWSFFPYFPSAHDSTLEEQARAQDEAEVIPSSIIVNLINPDILAE